MGSRPPPAPFLAEVTIPAAELRRLRAAGIRLEKRLKVGRAGITEGIVNGIHERWRRSELVKIKCEDMCKMNMKRTHDTLEVSISPLRFHFCVRLLRSNPFLVCMCCRGKQEVW